MSAENPGDGTSCDHCGCKPTETRDGRLGFLSPYTGERLCSLCMEIKRQRDVHDATTDPNTGLRWIQVRDERYRRD